MRYQACPQCRNLNTEHAVFCLFCGTPLRAGASRVLRESANSPRVRATFAWRAQSVLLLLALCSALLAALYPVIAREYALLSSRMIEPSARAASAGQDNAVFSQSSGTYPIQLYLSQVVSSDDATNDAADDIAGQKFDGEIIVSVDPGGSGSIQINQAFFTPNAIQVAAFKDPEGKISVNTLYGSIRQSGMKISIVCVCEDGAISGFIWLDNDLSHIEFLYYS